MSTAETHIFNTSAAVVRDLAVKTFDVKLDDKKQLFWMRMVKVIVAAFCVLCPHPVDLNHRDRCAGLRGILRRLRKAACCIWVMPLEAGQRQAAIADCRRIHTRRPYSRSQYRCFGVANSLAPGRLGLGVTLSLSGDRSLVTLCTQGSLFPRSF